MYETNLLLIGTVTSTVLSKLFVNARISPGPAEIVQRYLIKGLCNVGLKSVEVVAAPRIPAYPSSSIKQVPFDEWYLGQIAIHSIGFNNYAGIGFIDRERKVRAATLKWAEKYKNESKTIVVYSMHSPFLKAANEIKKSYPKTTVAIVVPDLPQYMSVQKGVIKILKEYDMKRINKLMTCVDKYILYTKYMADYFQLEKGKWTILEGLIDDSKIVPNIIPKLDGRPICMYAGRLDTRYAIDILIEAFGNVPEADLHLYGSPSDATKFTNLIKKYDNVTYMGALTQDEVFQRMRKVNLLINPRPTNLELSKYSCPSKTFEYMASGTPVLMTKLPGLPEEYYPYLFFIEEETIDGISRAIKKVLSYSKEQLYEKGRLAQEFLLTEKNADMQVKRIINFICH